MMLSVFDTFAGAGGFSLGFAMAGCRVSGAIEMDRWACDTFEHNHRNLAVQCADMTTMSDGDILSVFGSDTPDIVIGGPPCQGFSVCNKKSGDPNDPRNTLFREFIRTVRLARPEIVVMENVPRLEVAKTDSGEQVIDIICEELDSLGYLTSHAILEATSFGIPQIRKRLFVVGSRVRLEEPFPSATHYVRQDNERRLFESELEPCPTLWDAISDLPQIEAGQGGPLMHFDKPVANGYQKRLRGRRKTIANHVAMKHSQRMVKRFAAMSCGETVSDLPHELRPLKRNGHGEISTTVYDQNNRRMHGDRPCHTIPASFYANFVHPIANRNFTPREGARIQGFPDSYVFKGKPTVVSHKLLDREGRLAEKHLCQYNQIGNAVPPLLAEQIARHLIKQLAAV
jgi:DNA (cytosine-5)-methyltransferase 1